MDYRGSRGNYGHQRYDCQYNVNSANSNRLRHIPHYAFQQYSSGVLTPTTLSGGIPSSLSTGTAPLLTPSTLASIEQIIDLHNEPSSSATDLTTQSGFVPPIVEPVASSIGTMVKQEYQDLSYGATASQEEDAEWLPPSAKRSRTTASSGSMVTATPHYSLPAVTPNATVTSTGTRRPTGPRARKPAVQVR